MSQPTTLLQRQPATPQGFSPGNRRAAIMGDWTDNPFAAGSGDSPFSDPSVGAGEPATRPPAHACGCAGAAVKPAAAAALLCLQAGVASPGRSVHPPRAHTHRARSCTSTRAEWPAAEMAPAAVCGNTTAGRRRPPPQCNAAGAHASVAGDVLPPAYGCRAALDEGTLFEPHAAPDANTHHPVRECSFLLLAACPSPPSASSAHPALGCPHDDIAPSVR